MINLKFICNRIPECVNLCCSHSEPHFLNIREDPSPCMGVVSCGKRKNIKGESASFYEPKTTWCVAYIKPLKEADKILNG